MSDMYPRGLQGFLAAELEWSPSTSLDFKVQLLNSHASGAFSGSDQDLADINASAIYASGLTSALTSLTNTNGTADAGNPTITALSQVGSTTVSALLLYYAHASAASSLLIAHYDASSVTGLPLTPNGGDVTIQWHGSGAFKFS